MEQIWSYGRYIKINMRMLTVQEKALMRVCVFVFTADRVGKFVVAGGAAVGLGALCYYGMGMSSDIGAIERAA